MQFQDIIKRHYPSILDYDSRDIILHRECLAWSKDLEHAVFYTREELHPASVLVWFNPKRFNWKTGQYDTYTEKFEFRNGIWWLLRDEITQSYIRFTNNNPFYPDVKSVFPQNM